MKVSVEEIGDDKEEFAYIYMKKLTQLTNLLIIRKYKLKVIAII